MAYAKVDHKFWRDPRVRRWDDSTKLFAQYLLTCSHRNTEGLFWLPKDYIASDLGWSIEGISEALQTLSDEGFALYDDDTQTVLIVKAIKYDTPKGEKSVKGAINALGDVPPTPLFATLLDVARQYAPELADGIESPELNAPVKDHLRVIEGASEGHLVTAEASSSSSNSAPAHPPSSDADDDADHGSLNGFGSGLPRQPAEGRSLAGTVQDWLAEPPRDHHIRPRDKRSDDYRALIEGVCEHVDMGLERRHVQDVAHRITCEYVAEVRGEPLSDAASKQVRSFIGEYAKQPALALWGLAEAVMHGAGLTGEHAGNPQALPNYARSVIEGNLASARKAAS